MEWIICMPKIDVSLVETVAYLYYEKEWPQSKIATTLGISKSKVSRFASKAKEMGIVKIEVKKELKTNTDLERELIKKFPLKDALVVRMFPYDDLLEQVGRAGAFYLNMFLKDGDIFGVSVGKTVSAVFDHLKSKNLNSLQVVQLMGGFDDVAPYNPLSLVSKGCERLNARGVYASVPVIVENEEMKLKLMKNETLLRVIDYWNKCNVAIAGIGAIDTSSIFVRSNILTEGEIVELKKKGARGSMLGHFFDENGKLLNLELRRRIISISWDQIMKIERLIAVSGGQHKIEAIRSALRTGTIDVLITDEITADGVVSEK